MWLWALRASRRGGGLKSARLGAGMGGSRLLAVPVVSAAALFA